VRRRGRPTGRGLGRADTSLYVRGTSDQTSRPTELKDAGLPVAGAIAVGVVAAVASLALGWLYESRRLAALIARDAPAEGTDELT
jgi:hypothetical protein